ncbi:hypothetical protein [Natrinema sp. DC36]|uniref:hypothetical protein n=1 Tax=Natrinema sp. DC36 TaxID=2878680 RepID=UPI001CEFD3B3|nr:hypothetical protein [Natrinema sp. DC36]
MSTESKRTGGVQQHTDGPMLADCGDGEVLWCRDSESGLEWYFEDSDGQTVRYHELFDFECSVVLRGQVGLICSHSCVEVDVVGKWELERERGEIDG